MKQRMMRTTPVHLLQGVVVAALVATCQAPVATPSPFGGTWWVSALNGTAVDRFDAPEIQFTVGGEVRGSSGCHDFSAPFRVDGARITVGDAIPKPLDSVCPERVRNIEAALPRFGAS
jgi:heat shock protein HslJ